MIGRIRRNVQADLLILGKDRIVQGTFVLIIIWIFFGMKRALYYAKGIQHVGGCYLNESYILLVQNTCIFLVMCGGKLGTQKKELKTYCIRCVYEKRWITALCHLISLLLLAVEMLLLHWLIGTFCDLYLYKGAGLQWSTEEIAKMLCIVLGTVFWGWCAYLCALLTESISITVSLGMLMIVLQGFLSSLLDINVLKWIPTWQKNNMLCEFLNKKIYGEIVLTQFKFGNFGEGLCFTLVFVAAIGVISIWIEHNTEY